MILDQNKKNFSKLETEFKAMAAAVTRENAGNRILHKKYSKTIAKLTGKIFGIKLKLTIKDDYGMAYCFPNPITLSNPLLDSSMRNSLEGNINETDYDGHEKYLKTLIANPGTIDRKKAKVGGGFSEIECEMVLDIVTLVRVMRGTGTEIFATFLHEIGHLWSYFEESTSVRSGNAFLNEVVTNLKSEGKNFSVKEYSAHIKDLAKDKDIHLDIVDQMQGTDSRPIFTIKVLRMADELARSELNSLGEDNLEAERQADMFAARCGYGVELARFLSRVEGGMTVAEQKAIRDKHINQGDKTQLAKEVSSGTMTFYLMILLAIPFGIPLVILGVIGVLILSLVATEMWLIDSIFKFIGIDLGLSRDQSYDESHKRVRKIYYATLSSLKDSKLPKERLRSIIKDVEDLKALSDTISSAAESKTGTIMRKVAVFAFHSFGGTNTDTSLNNYIDQLQELSSNELFLEAAKLKLEK